MRRKSVDAPNVKEITFILSQHYHDWDHYNYKNPLEELLFILCSIQTNEDLYRYTYAALRRSYPTFKALADASETEIADLIVNGGLSSQKAHKIKQILGEIIEQFGKTTLAPVETNERYRTRDIFNFVDGGRKKNCPLRHDVFPG